MSTVQTASSLQSVRRQACAVLAGWLIAANVAALLAAGCLARVWELDHLPGINGDEAWYGVQAMKLLHGEPFSWRTPTNNLLNGFFFLPLVALHAVWEPSAVLLRLPAVLSGLLALPVNYALCRKLYGQPTALVSTLLLAVLPVNIAYSRFGWDASQTLLVTLLVTYLPLLALKQPAAAPRWLIAAAVALAAGLWVHPTNIFTAPLVAMPLVWLSREELLAAWRRPRPMWQWLAAGSGGLLVLSLVAWLARHWVVAVGQRLLAPHQLTEFAWNYQRLFSGLTVYRYIPGSLLPDPAAEGQPPLAASALDAAFLLGGVVAGVALFQLLRRQRSPFDGCLLAGWGLMLLGFFLVAGPGAIAPHYERYGLCFIAPGGLVLSRGLIWLLSRPGSLGPASLAASLAMAWLLLAGVERHYFDFFHTTGGRSHDTFRTARQEPKEAALDYILRRRDPAEMTWIITTEYWNDLPLRYLAAASDGLRIERWPDVRDDASFRRALTDGRCWFVEFSDRQPYRQLRRTLDNEQAALEETRFADYAGNPVISVLGP